MPSYSTAGFRKRVFDLADISMNEIEARDVGEGDWFR
jgi:hypothetical protein